MLKSHYNFNELPWRNINMGNMGYKMNNKIIGIAATLSICGLVLFTNQVSASADDTDNEQVSLSEKNINDKTTILSGSPNTDTSSEDQNTESKDNSSTDTLSQSSESDLYKNVPSSVESSEPNLISSSENSVNSTSVETPGDKVETEQSVTVTDLGSVHDVAEISTAQSAADAVYAATGQAQEIVAYDAGSYSYTDAFLDRIKQGALDGWDQYGVLPSITAAQAICESAWGQSQLTTQANNLFGIKGSYNGHSVTFPTGEYYGGRYVTVNAAFRAYSNYAESIDDHGNFLANNSRYSNLIGDTNYNSVANKLHSDGYATSPTYASTLINIINTYHLYDWDYAAFHKYNTVKEQLYANYDAVITENGNRNDGVFVNGGYNTNSSNINSVQFGKNLVGTRVHVTSEQSVSNGATYVEFSMNGGSYWIDKAALTIQYATQTKTKSVDYAAIISQGNRSDGIYYGGAYLTNYNSTASNDHGKYYNGVNVHVVGETTSGGAVYYEFEYNGQNYWMNKDGFKIIEYNTVSDYKTVDKNVVLNQSIRHDGIYYGGVYFTNGSTYYGNQHGQYYDGVAVHVTAEEKSNGATYVQFEYKGQLYWIDKAGTKEINVQSYTETKADYNILLNQSGRYDGIYYGTPFGCSLDNFKNNTHGQYFNGLTVHVVSEAKTSDGVAYVQFEYLGQKYWIDKAGTINMGKSYTVNGTNYGATINQTNRYDGIYFAGPFGSSSFSLVANNNGKYFNNAKINIVAETKYNGTTHVEFFLNGSFYWMDKAAVKI